MKLTPTETRDGRTLETNEFGSVRIDPPQCRAGPTNGDGWGQGTRDLSEFVRALHRAAEDGAVVVCSTAPRGDAYVLGGETYLRSSDERIKPQAISDFGVAACAGCPAVTRVDGAVDRGWSQSCNAWSCPRCSGKAADCAECGLEVLLERNVGWRRARVGLPLPTDMGQGPRREEAERITCASCVIRARVIGEFEAFRMQVGREGAARLLKDRGTEMHQLRTEVSRLRGVHARLIGELRDIKRERDDAQFQLDDLRMGGALSRLAEKLGKNPEPE